MKLNFIKQNSAMKIFLSALFVILSLSIAHAETSAEYNNLGIKLAKKGETEQAILNFNKAIELNPDNAKAYNNRGQAYITQGNLEEALQDFTRAIAVDPSYAKAYNRRALTYYELKDYENAWADVRKAESLGAMVNLDFINELMQATK